MKREPKGFTLIELLVVIGILAVLATIVIVVLNPAQLFAQGRDAKRIGDLAGLRNSVVLYLATNSSPQLNAGSLACGTEFAATVASVSSTFAVSTQNAAHSAVFAIDGTGWVSINFASTSGGSPLSTLPRDPTNNTTYYYGYSCDNTNKWFEVNANMESARYANGGADDVESRDGGNNANIYEVGNAPGLAL